MEIRKNKTENILKIISAILSISITAICIYVYFNRLFRMIFIPQSAITMFLLFTMFTIVEYMYIYSILKLLKNKKIIKSILLITLIVLSVIGIVFIKDNINYLFRNIILMLVFILGVVCLPLIILGKIILEENNKYKKIKIFIICIVMMYTYISNWELMIDYANKIMITISENPINKLVSLREEEKVDTSYLYEFTQILSKKGYLSQGDVKQIITIADSKSSIIWINYKDEMEKIEINTVNKKDDEIEELKEILKSDYYQFNYDINENNEVVININRYVIEKVDRSEKNEEIVLTGNRNNNIIKNINKYVSEDHQSFLFENELNIKRDSEDKSLKSFKILLDYDKENNNFIPVTQDTKEYELIYSYRVYQSGVEIILKEDITLDNKDYTIRLNRYDNNLNVTNNSSFYEYEPVVTQMTTYKNKIVLEMKFNRDYSIDEIKNIEIIFGK